MPRPRDLWVALAALAGVTLALLAIRASLDKTHVALAYLLVVLGVSARSGRGLGLTTSVLAFLCFDVFFLPPHYALTVADPIDWAVLGAFLITSLVSAHLLARARTEATSAQTRAVEIERLSKEAERAEALRKADEFKDAMLASVSHDLRTPLTTIKALAHEITRDGDERAAIIEEEADRLNRFVADLLDLSRIAGGALHLKPEINAAEDLIGAALQRVSGAVGERKVVATLDPAEPLLLGRFDFPQSLRILANLLENALKFSPLPSHVELSARRVGGMLEFIVADRGHGVLESDRDRIFAPFYTQDRSPKNGNGAGLGLAIARGLAEAQGGALSYTPRDGGGSVFAFRVPAADVVDLDTGGDQPQS